MDKLVTYVQRACYSQQYEESFFSLVRLRNTHEGEKSMKET